ncbi:hypothetical protein FN846DRAFT_891277 [Sphaerosporella brunnea]|uniref:Uncharacterized protein n=1 Tax=Sphaerosporella brunnea TaxID=1250544 RepID=A0A5J5EU26_9PEZI|nr:hypothetical protein FN846DRAFT_891277 [Sphaerosporella brunnea]
MTATTAQSSHGRASATRIGTAIGAGAYTVYLYNELVEKPLSIYPSEAAAMIKRALYYASRGEVGDMANAFKQAIQIAEQSVMHPLSDEVAGLKTECAQLLLKAKDGQYAAKAVEILEHVLDEAYAGAKCFEKQSRWKGRNKVLKRAVLLGYKIGEIYQDLGKDDKAEEPMEESKKPEEENDEDWFDSIATSACFEYFTWHPYMVEADRNLELAQHYERTAQYYLATPLYLKAVSLLPPKTCHAITLMNNLATTLSRQQLPEGAKFGKVTRAHLLDNAQKWAEKALEMHGS